MLVRHAGAADLPAVLALLRGAGLPLAGVREHLRSFLLAETDEPIGVAGIEVYDQIGLLRSVAVLPAFHSRGVARQLILRAVETARSLHLTDLYLLTTGAEGYFPRFGFAQIPREHAPCALLASREFQDACPQTASLMHLSLKEMPMTLTPDQTQAFLDALAPHAGKALEFQLHGETLVGPGYHVTEVKAVTVEAMDCGGRPAAWRETVIQLWNPGDEEERGFMAVEKFLGIYRTVAARVPVRAEAELRFEYGDATHPTIQYRVAGVEAGPERVVVQLAFPAVSCKPRDERLAAEAGSCAPDSGCCGPSPVQLMNLETAPTKGC